MSTFFRAKLVGLFSETEIYIYIYIYIHTYIYTFQSVSSEFLVECFDGLFEILISRVRFRIGLLYVLCCVVFLDRCDAMRSTLFLFISD